MPIKGTGSGTKTLRTLKAIEEEEHGPILALPPSESPEKMTQRAVVALPHTSMHQMSTSTRDIDNRSTKM